MNWLWFAAGYAVAMWLRHEEQREEDLARIENYANNITVDDMEGEL